VDYDDEDDDEEDAGENAMLMQNAHFNGVDAAQLLVGMVPSTSDASSEMYQQGRSMRAYKKKGVLHKGVGFTGIDGDYSGAFNAGMDYSGAFAMGPPIGGLGTPFYSSNSSSSSQRQTRGSVASVKALPVNKRGGLRGPTPIGGPSGLTPNLQLMELASPSFFQSPFKNMAPGGPSPGFGFTPGNHYTFGSSPQSKLNHCYFEHHSC